MRAQSIWLVLVVAGLAGGAGALDLQAIRKHSEGGDLAAAKVLAGALIRGEGVPQNLPEGLAWAKRIAATGDAEGQLLVYFAMTADPARGDEAFGYENLARAASQGNVQALGLLAAHYGDKVGADNHGRAERLFAMHAQLADATSYRSWLALVKHWGATRVSPKLMQDSMGTAMAVAGAARTGCKDIRPQKLAIASGLRSAVYLPLQHAALEESYLVGGDWTEHWTFSVCGAEATVEGTFRALGGSAFGFTFRKTG